MKPIEMTDLRKGDIFTHEIKLHGREAFIALEDRDPKKKSILVQSRTTDKKMNKSVKGLVIFLRNEIF